MLTRLQRISLGTAVGVLLAAVLVSAAVVATSIHDLDVSFDNAERPAEVTRTLVRLVLAVSDAESAQRGYLLTGETSYLEPYEGTRRETDSLLTRLDTLVSWNPAQVARMPELRAVVADKQNEMDEVMSLYGRGDRAGALALVQTDQGAVIMDAIRDRTDVMRAEARRVRRIWADRVVRARRRALVATAVTNLVLFGLIALVALGLRRFLAERERASADLAASNRGLTQAVAEREAALANVQAMQAQLVQQEKLAGLGRLSAGVAHELKNPLNFVTNFAELAGELADEAREALDAGHDADARERLAEVHQNTAKVLDHARRADDIVRAMLVHARGVSGDRQPVDLADLLATVASQAVGPADEGRPVEVALDLDPALRDAPLAGIPTALGRLFLNLAENAVQSVRERAGRDGDAYTPTVRLAAHAGQDRLGKPVAVVTVEDNGPGISDTALPRIFEPFYTTKAPGQGTGLGLSLAYDIAVGHGGTIAAARSPLGGACFTVKLPLGGEPGAVAPDAPLAEQAPAA